MLQQRGVSEQAVCVTALMTAGTGLTNETVVCCRLYTKAFPNVMGNFLTMQMNAHKYTCTTDYSQNFKTKNELKSE